jgi:hypothetical protein
MKLTLSGLAVLAGIEPSRRVLVAEAIVAWGLAMRAFCNRVTMHT